ncbi:MFS transporter [Arthrobacter sp. MSA 4-2]|uniref:MFS transporter n=1 Tax=Arthrobacter sp. MSA 4-2 TaxID=2794349 RepID=UPI0018E6F0A7|nr:MFS transporter [Arthrobacter sp. MSA 4-2]MBJ2120617.1 MFS transporter [Arthrobacter sp. MSA 4-2]
MSVLRELRMQQPSAAARWSWDASLAARLVLAVTVISTLLIGANLATPLYPLISANLGLTSFDITMAFSAYVLTLVAGLLLVGHWSDHIGRRAALVLAVLVGLLGAAVFAGASSLGGLILGRSLQGAAVALATGASSAALRDLLPHRPDWASRFTLLASAGGVAAGPVIGGVLSLLPDPTRTPFLVYTAVLTALLLPLLLLRARPAIQPAAAARPLTALRPRRPTVSRAARNSFWMAAAVGFFSFSIFGFTLSLAPTWIASLAGTDARPVIGVLAALVLGASAVSQLLFLRGRFVVPAGLTAMAAGVGLLPVAGAQGSLPLLIGCCVAAGLGQGMAFRVVFNRVSLQVEAALHAQIISTLYVITYLGSAVPVLGLGAAAAFWGIDPAVAGYAAVVGGACTILAAVALVGALRQPAGPGPVQPAG